MWLIFAKIGAGDFFLKGYPSELLQKGGEERRLFFRLHKYLLSIIWFFLKINITS